MDLKEISDSANGGASAAESGFVASLRSIFPGITHAGRISATSSRLATGLLLAVFSASALCQAPPPPRPPVRPPDSGSLLEGLKQPAIPPASTDSPAVLPKTPEPRPALGAPGLKVVVKAFKVSGNTLFPEDVLLATLTDFVGKEQNIDGLNDAATKVRAYYRERGYFLAQAYLPQQEIKDGLVEIAVIEARVGKVSLNFKEGTRFSEKMIKGIIDAHLKEGDIITETGLETPLLLLNDFPNAVVTSEIKASQTVGAADLTVHVSDTPGWISGSVDIDNGGNRFTGQYRYGVSVNINSPLALGDQLSYRAFITDDEMGFYRLAYVVPVGYWGTRVGVSYSDFHYRLGKQFIDAQSHGVGAVSTLFAFHPIIRTRSANLILQAAYEEKILDDRDDVSGTIVDRKVLSNKLGVVGDFRDGVFGGGLNSYSFTLTAGNLKISPAAILAGDQAATGPKTAGPFSKYNYEYRRLQKITDQSTLLLAIVGQKASKNLTSSEKFSLGGPDGVRAYPVGEGLGDSGYVMQAEYRYLVPGVKMFNGDFTLSTFYDQGLVTVQENFVYPASGTTPLNANLKRLNGWGVGASLGRDSDFVVRVSAAWRIENELPTSDTATRIPRVWAQAIKWF